MLFAFVFNVDEHIMEVYYYKNIELFCQDLIDIALKYSQCINQSKKHDLVFEIVIMASENHLQFITFLDFHLMVSIDEIELDKILS